LKLYGCEHEEEEEGNDEEIISKNKDKIDISFKVKSNKNIKRRFNKNTVT
jgi:hypothetical protein